MTRQQAIRILDRATDQGSYDDWWCEMMEGFGLYDKEKDTWNRQ